MDKTAGFITFVFVSLVVIVVVSNIVRNVSREYSDTPLFLTDQQSRLLIEEDRWSEHFIRKGGRNLPFERDELDEFEGFCRIYRQAFGKSSKLE